MITNLSLNQRQQQIAMLAAIAIFLTACGAPSPTPIPATANAVPPTGTSAPLTSTPISPTLALPTATNTPDACAGATAVGARQKFSFEQIIPCLKTVAQVAEFMKNNVQYDVQYDIREHGAIEYEPAALVYERGIDDANGYAILECYFLERNGGDAFVLGLSIETPGGSNVCGIQSDGGILVLQGAGQIAGPFVSFADLAKYYTDLKWMKTGGTIRSLKASQVTQVTTDRTSPSILGLPWVSHPY